MLEQIPCAFDIGRERRNRVAVGDADDGLRGQMKDDFDFILTKRALNEIAVGDIPAHGIDLFDAPAADEFALRNPVAHEANDVRTRFKQLLHQPRTEQSGAAGDEDRAISPKRIHSAHTFHGVFSLAQSSFRILIFAIGVHGIEEAVVAIGHELTFTRQPFQRFAFEDAIRTAEIIEYAPVEDKKAGAD